MAMTAHVAIVLSDLSELSTTLMAPTVCLPVHPHPHAMFVFAMTEIHVPNQLSPLLERRLIEAVKLDAVRHALWMSKLTVLSHVLDKICF